MKFKTVNWITNKKSSSYKPQALKKLIKKISKEDIINETVPHNDIEEAQAASLKRQARKATSRKLQATSNKRPHS